MKTSIWVSLTVATLAAAAATASDAKPLPTCKSACQRLTDCKLSSYTRMCLDSCKQHGYEASEAGRAQLLVFTRSTCKQIQSAVGATDAHPQQHASTRRDDGDDADADADATGQAAGRHDRGQRSYQPGSGNDPRDSSCSWVCRRLTECNLTSSQRCGEMCAIAASNGQPLRIGRESCPEIRKAFVSNKWTCWAEASVGFAYGNGPWTYGNKSVPANGRTRDEAALAASRDCNALVSVDDNTSSLSGAAVDSGLCKVTRCLPPGTPLF